MSGHVILEKEDMFLKIILRWRTSKGTKHRSQLNEETNFWI